MMTYPVLQVVNGVARLVLSVVIQDSVGVRPVKGPLYLQHKRTRHRAKISLRSTAVGQKTLNYAARSDLVTKHKSGDPSHKLGEEDEREEHGVLHGDSRAKHGIQGPAATSNTPRSHHSRPLHPHPPPPLVFPPAASHQLQHPRASSAGGEASKQAKNNDDGSRANEDIRGVGGVVRDQGDVRAQHQLPPYSHRKQDGSCYLCVRGGETGANRGKVVSRRKRPHTTQPRWLLSV